MSGTQESDAVQAFIRERQAAVLATAIEELRDCALVDLPEVAHRAAGTVGSYQLTTAHAVISDLRAVLSDPNSAGGSIEQARLATVAALQDIERNLPA